MTGRVTPHIRPVNESRDDPSSVESLIRDAHCILDNCGIALSPGRVKTLVRDYKGRAERNGWGFFDYLATSVQLGEERRHAALRDPEIARVIAYRDPTGETAVNHVLRSTRHL